MFVSCLHGFLGTGNSWDIFRDSLSENFDQKMDVWCPDLLKEGSLSPQQNLDQWPKNFNDISHQQNEKRDNAILVGYSMGGRLALHAAVQKPSNWSALVLISTNPGFETEHKKSERLINDNKWADRFLNEDWNELIESWNAQPVFQGSQSRILNKNCLPPRDLAAQALRSWSVAQHGIGLDDLKKLNIPTLWVCGSKDVKFMKIYEKLNGSGVPGDYSIIEDAGHRVLLDQPQQLAKNVSHFLRRTLK